MSKKKGLVAEEHKAISSINTSHHNESRLSSRSIIVLWSYSSACFVCAGGGDEETDGPDSSAPRAPR